MTIYFYSTREEPYGCFSNFSAHGFELDGCWWSTSEHYFQAQKFITTDPDWFEQVKAVESPMKAANMGRSRQHPMRADWEAIKDQVMYQAVLAKFTGNSEIQKILLNTDEEEIIEKALGDYYWGCGKDGSGQNKLGQILMRVRAEIKQGKA